MKQLRLAFVVVSLSLFSTSAFAQPTTREERERDYVRGVVFVVTKPQPAYEKPDATSKQVGAVKPTVGLLLFLVDDGWVQVELPGDGYVRGWVRGTRADIIEGNQLTVVTRTMDMEGKPWPAAVKQDILHGRVRLGFTGEQVTIAHAIDPSNDGRPDAKMSEETADGVVETWQYGNVVYTFKAGKVAKINRIE